MFLVRMNCRVCGGMFPCGCGGILGPLRHHGDFSRQSERNDYEGLATISANNQKVAAVEPIVELLESTTAHLDLDASVAPQNRDGNVAGKPAAGTTAQWDSFGCQSCVLQVADESALAAVTFVA
jgi:hypothetical protein